MPEEETPAILDSNGVTSDLLAVSRVAIPQPASPRARRSRGEALFVRRKRSRAASTRPFQQVT